MKIEIKHRYTAAVLFGFECENNSVKLTLEAAIKAGANLNGANLNGAYLRGAYLSGANLNGAMGSNSRISSLQHDKYRLVILDKEMCWGGCTKMTCAEWLAYDGAELDEYDKNYLETITKPFIRMVLATTEQGK